MKKSKWILFISAVIIMAANFLNKEPAHYQQLSPADLIPVAVITAVIFLLKAGVLTALLMGLKKLWNRLRKKL